MHSHLGDKHLKNVNIFHVNMLAWNLFRSERQRHEPPHAKILVCKSSFLVAFWCGAPENRLSGTCHHSKTDRKSIKRSSRSTKGIFNFNLCRCAKDQDYYSTYVLLLRTLCTYVGTSNKSERERVNKLRGSDTYFPFKRK